MSNSTSVNRAYRERHPEKARAHQLVAQEIRMGRLVALPCERCGACDAHAHHEDYTKPLDVVWLCQLCHVQRHVEISQAAGFVSKKYVAKGIEYPKHTFLEDAKRLRAAGNSYSQIAAALGISRGSAYKWVNDKDYNKS